MSSPFSLPSELVDEAREDRSDQWLQTIVSDIDRMRNAGMRGLEQAARTAIEPLTPIQQALEQGGLQLPSREDLRLDWATPDTKTLPQVQGFATNVQTGIQVPSVADLTPGSAARPAGGTPAAMPTGAPPQPETLGEIEEGNPARYFATAGPYARQVEQETGIPAALSLAISANETGYGQRRYMAGSNNYHGIQALPGEQGAVPYKDWRPGAGGQQEFYNAAQRSFGTPLDGFRGFARFLLDNPRYKPALDRYQQTHDVNQLAADIHQAGYAEDPAYTTKITSIMRGIPVSTGVGEVVDQRGVPLTQQQGPQPVAMPEQARPQAEDVAQAGLDDADKWSLCGPVAAVIAANTRGKNWTVADAKQIAVQNQLWDASTGMYGLQAQVRLLNKMGLGARTGPANQAALAADAQAGNTPIISTPLHYFILKGYDPQTGKFDTSTSGTALRRGSRYLTLQEISDLGGGIQGAAYMDNPASPTPSAVAPPSNTDDPTARRARDALAMAAPAPAVSSPPQPDAGASDLDAARATDGGGQDVMLRGPLSQQPELPPDYDPIVQEMGYTVPGLQPSGGATNAREQAAASNPQTTPAAPTPPPPPPPPQPIQATGTAEVAPQVTERPTLNIEGATSGPAPTPPGYTREPAPTSQTAELPLAPRQAAPQVAEEPLTLDQSVPSPPGWSALVDAAGEVKQWVQNRLSSDPSESTAAPDAETPVPSSPYAPGQAASMTPPAENRMPANPDPWDGAGAAFGPGGLLEPAGGGPRIMSRIQEIRQQAAAELGRSPIDQRVTDDPGWRARHPDEAQEIDGLENQLGLVVAGQVGDTPKSGATGPDAAMVDPLISRARRALGAGVENAADAGAAARPALPEGAQPIRASEAAEVERLRLDKFPEEVRDLIETGAKEQDWARVQRRGVLPDDVVQRMAADDAKSVDDLIKGSRAGRAYNAEETIALRNATASQADVVRGLTDEIAEARANGMTPDLLIARRAAEAARLNGLINLAEGARAEAGRALRAYRQQAELIDLDPNRAIQQIYKRLGGKENAEAAVDEYTKLVQDGANPIQLAKFWAKVESGQITGADLFSLYRRFNMLSGPRTIEVNGLSGGLNLGYEVATDALGQIARGRLGEAAAEVAAPFKAAGRAFQNFAETTWHGVSMEQAARGDIPRTLSSRTDNRVAKAALTAMEIPDRINAGVDQFFRTLTEDWAATRLAYRQARDAGLSPRSEHWGETVAKNLETIREDVTKFPEIQQLAARVTFSEEPGGIVKGLENLKRHSPNIVGFIMPFIRTPANIASRAVDISPFGIPRNAIEAGFNIGRGREQLGARTRDAVIGTAATIWAYQQAQMGNVTGAGPDDPEKIAALRATGWQPFSVKIGDQYWSYANFAPFSLALSTGAAASEAQKYAKPEKADTLSMLSDGAARTAKVVTDMTVLAGIGAVVKSIQDPDRYGTQWLTTALTQLMPAGSLINTVGQATDPYLRRSERTNVGTQVVQNLEARLPGLRETVPAAQDPLGRPIPNDQTGLGALNPARPTTERPDPVLQAFIDNGVDIGKPREKLALKNGVSIALTAEEQRRWNTLRGEAILRMTPSATSSPDYRATTPIGRQKTLERIRDRAAEEANGRMFTALGEAEIRRRMRGTP